MDRVERGPEAPITPPEAGIDKHLAKTAVRNRGMVGSNVSGSDRDPVKDDRLTLADAGIDKHLADRAR